MPTLANQSKIKTKQGEVVPMDAATENFVKEFNKDKTAYTNMKGKMVALNFLPEGVNPTDDRVKQIMLECKKRNNGKIS